MGYPLCFMANAAEIIKYTSTNISDLIWTEEDNNKFITNFLQQAYNVYVAPSYYKLLIK